MKDFAGRCIHFNGIQHDTCKAGVNYLVLAGGEQFGMAKRIPCIKDNGVDPAVCAACHYPDATEVAAMETEVQGHMDQLRERNTILGAAHTDAPHSLIYLCLLCPVGARTVVTDHQALLTHVVETHAVDEATVKQAKGAMAAHMDATDWYQTDDEFSLPDGRGLCIRSSRQRRRGADRAMWQDETPKGKKGRRR